MDFLLIILLGCIGITVLILALTSFGKQKEQTGFDLLKHFQGAQLIQPSELRCDKLRVFGLPDAIIKWQGVYLPVERKPFSQKLHTRHIFQLAVYMYLVQQSYKTSVPFGILILGPKARLKKIYNSPNLQRQIKLKAYELRNILEGLNHPIADPFPSKCKKCVVEHACQFSKAKLESHP